MYASYDGKKSGMPWWGIMLIVIGSLILAGAIGFGIWALVKRSRKPRYNFITEEKSKLVFNDDQW